VYLFHHRLQDAYLFHFDAQGQQSGSRSKMTICMLCVIFFHGDESPLFDLFVLLKKIDSSPFIFQDHCQ